MKVRFHLSTGAILDKDVPNMNDIGHVANTLAKFGRVYIDDFKGAVLKEHVVYMEEAPEEAFEYPEEEKIRGEKLHSMVFDEFTSPGGQPFDPQDREPIYGPKQYPWHPGRG